MPLANVSMLFTTIYIYNLFQKNVHELKTFLANWRFIILSLKPILLWEKPWYPAALITIVTTIFSLIWLTELNTLTVVALTGFGLNFVNFYLPCVHMLIHPIWTEEQEELYREICYNAISKYYKTANLVTHVQTMRVEKPVMYFSIMFGVLCIVIWITSTVSNIFLLYLITLIMVLRPGLSHTSIYNKCLSFLRNVFNLHVH
ncbi:hypothetical protein K1T71_000423 [Dendrolimus kikuchii]|uniref:Uncharacterized protein n=1 Tax=Dendrolimus kikuchii TaxID=765133 RepID=A0ACC1DJN2_9NEOP|nr:hypothetical protein K1T71_000423 [Dendrolimus kikuchii]